MNGANWGGQAGQGGKLILDVVVTASESTPLTAWIDVYPGYTASHVAALLTEAWNARHDPKYWFAADGTTIRFPGYPVRVESVKVNGEYVLENGKPTEVPGLEPLFVFAVS
jgi:hypothetical protein